MNAVMYKEIPCPVCLSKDHKIFLLDTLQGNLPNFDYNFTTNHSRTYQMVRCQQCTHVYSSPIPTEIWKNYVSVLDNAYLRLQITRMATSKELCRILTKFAPKGSLLDIGCATGDFLSVAKAFYDVQGLELSSWSRDVASKHGFEIHSRFLSELKKDGAYDVITMWGVIEHFENPRLEISEIFRLLKPGGIVALWTGNIDGFFSRILGKKWWNIQGQHIQQFSKKSLVKLFEDKGFKKEWIGIYPAMMQRDAIIQSLGRYPFVSRITTPLIRKIFPSNFVMPLYLPGEMFAVFRKPLAEK